MDGVSDGRKVRALLLEVSPSQHNHMEASWKIRISGPTITELQCVF